MRLASSSTATPRLRLRGESNTAPTNGEIATAMARKEVVLSAGAVGSPQLLLLSGIGPKDELEAAGVPCRLDLPEVGKHLKDHLQVALFFPAPGVGVSMSEVAISMGPDALRAPAGPLPADPADDEIFRRSCRRSSPKPSAGSSSGPPPAAASYRPPVRRGRLVLDRPRRPAQPRRSDRVLRMRIQPGPVGALSPCRPGTNYFDDPDVALSPTAENMIVLANPVQPRSEGEVRLASADPADAPDIRMNYYSDPHDMKVMLAVIRRALDVVAHWPPHRQIGPLLVPPCARRQTRLRAGRGAERRPARGPRPPLLAHRLPPHSHLPDRQRRRPRASGAGRRRDCGSPTPASCRTS